jgi:DNA polymerase-3 subunit chi
VTEIAFHFGATDKLAYVCRLLRKAVGSGAKVHVRGDAATVARLDSDLWALSPTDFVPHCTAFADASVIARSGVVLATGGDQSGGVRDVLVNLCGPVPEGYETYNRLIEVVGMDDADRQVARFRWKFYTGQGYPITRHDLAVKRAD